MMKNYFLFLILTLFSFSILGQVQMEEEQQDPEHNFKRSIMMGLNFQLGFPQGAFRDNLEKKGWGFGGNILGSLRNDNRISMGVDFSIQTYDRESLTENELINGIIESFRVTTKNHVANMHFLVRFQPEVNFFIEPYVEGLLGAKWFYTRTEINDLNSGSNETLSSDFDRGDIAASYGAALGFQINLKDRLLFLDGRLAYLRGTSAEYLVRRPNDTGGYLDPIEAFEARNSVTDLLIPQIGFKFLIGFGYDQEEEYYEEEEFYEEEREEG